MTITFANHLITRRWLISFVMLALVVLLGLGVFLWNRTSTTQVNLTKEDICLLTTVKVGDYEMPAFNTASYRVMSKRLENTNFKPRCAVDAPLELHYKMSFDAQKINWQAELVALDKEGKEVWRGVDSAAIQNVGAFQYTTESVAERLLEQFLATR
jgi:lipopolysaccharide export system protein LptC